MMSIPHAIRQDGQWVEISGSFQSGDGDDAVNHPAGWLDAVTEAEAFAVGAYPINAPEAPGNDRRIVGRRLEDRNGRPAWVYDTELVPPAEREAAKRAEVDDRAARAFAAGYNPTLPAFAGERLQVRNNEDRTNWLTSQAAYAAAVAGGLGEVQEASFRTASNRTITVSYSEGLQVLLAMAGWGRTILGRSWALKDAIAAGQPYDIETGWPQ